jgi:pilus assembly protein Flp/PilA
VKDLLRRFAKDETAATTVKYGLIAAGIAVVLIGVLKNVGKDLTSTFKSIKKALK